MTTSVATDNLALQVTDLSKTYRVYNRPSDRLKEMILRRQRHEVVHALHPMSFNVKRGQCIGVVGANGAGKTTLLSLLTGTVAPTTGSIDIYGRISAILGLGVGMLATHSGRENIRHGLITRGIPAERHEELERQIIAFSELASAIDKPVQTYSSGMAMRLNFSIAHAVEPDILIVDEALAVGDARFIFKCQKKMREFLDRGKTLFFVSHNTTAVRELCTHALLLDKGKLLAQGEVSDVLQQYQLLYFREPPRSTPEKQSPASKPLGSGALELESVKTNLVDRAPGGVWQTPQGTDLQMEITIKTDEHIPAPAIGIDLRSGYGNSISGFSTVNHKLPLEPIQPGSFSLTIVMPLFVPAGMYRLELTLADLSTEQPRLLRIWEDLLLVNVKWSDYSISGVIDCGAEIQFRGQQYSMRQERTRRQGEKARRHEQAVGSG